MLQVNKYQIDFKNRFRPNPIIILNGGEIGKIFRGNEEQIGYGLFSRFMNWLSPLLKKYAQPLAVNAAKTVGKEIVSSVGNVANDLIEGKNVQDSINQNFENSVSTLKRKAEDALQSSNLLEERNLASDERLKNETIGGGIKRVKKPKLFILKNKKTNKKTFDDIFSDLNW